MGNLKARCGRISLFGHSKADLGATLGHLGPFLVPSWRRLGDILSHLGAILGHRGAILGHRVAILVLLACLVSGVCLSGPLGGHLVVLSIGDSCWLGDSLAVWMVRGCLRAGLFCFFWFQFRFV